MKIITSIHIFELLKMPLKSRSRNVYTQGTRSGLISTHVVTTQKISKGSPIGKARICVRLQLVWSNHCSFTALVLHRDFKLLVFLLLRQQNYANYLCGKLRQFYIRSAMNLRFYTDWNSTHFKQLTSGKWFCLVTNKVNVSNVILDSVRSTF